MGLNHNPTQAELQTMQTFGNQAVDPSPGKDLSPLRCFMKTKAVEGGVYKHQL